jgi:hypothetical protein
VLSKASEPTGRHSYLEDWKIDVPTIEWIYPVEFVAHTLTTQAPPAAAKNFCGSAFTTHVFPSSDDSQGFSDDFVKHYELSNGMEMSIPGAGSQKLLQSPKGVSWPSGTIKVTKDHWVGKCITANDGAKGLVMTDTNGTKYTFNKFLYRPAPVMNITNYRSGSAVSSVIPRSYIDSLATEVKDLM